MDLYKLKLELNKDIEIHKCMKDVKAKCFHIANSYNIGDEISEKDVCYILNVLYNHFKLYKILIYNNIVRNSTYIERITVGETSCLTFEPWRVFYIHFHGQDRKLEISINSFRKSKDIKLLNNIELDFLTMEKKIRMELPQTVTQAKNECRDMLYQYNIGDYLSREDFVWFVRTAAIYHPDFQWYINESAKPNKKVIGMKVIQNMRNTRSFAFAYVDGTCGDIGINKFRKPTVNS